MTPPEVCLNCHGAPDASPYDLDWDARGLCGFPEGGRPARLDCLQAVGGTDRQDPRLHREFRRLLQGTPLPRLPLRLPPITEVESLPPCPAETRWPEELRAPHPEARLRPWWVRANYERLRAAPQPIRIDVSRADLDVRLRPWPRAWLPLVRDWVYLASGPSGRIESHQVVRDNELDLLLRGLLEFEDISVAVPRIPAAFPLHRISTGDFGGLHAIAEVPTWLMFFIQPFMVPQLPAGHDPPRESDREFLAAHPWLDEECVNPTFARANAGICPAPRLYPDRRRPTSLLDLNLLALLQEGLRCRLQPLLDADERFPQFLNLEDLLRAILEMQDRQCPAGHGQALSREEVLDFIHSGNLVLHVAALNDLFVPGVLDLGRSRGTLRANLDWMGNLRAELEDFEIQLDPMGYGESLVVHGGRILPGAPTNLLGGAEDAGGIHAHLDLDAREIELQANLQLEADAALPFFGESEVRAQLILSLTLGSTADGFRPIPGHSTLTIRDLEVWSVEENQPRLQGAEIFLTDDPRRMDAVQGALAAALSQPLGVFRASGQWGEAQAFDFSGTVPLPVNADGDYDFAELFRQPSFELQGHILQARGRNYRGDLQLSNAGLALDPEEETRSQELALLFDVDTSTDPDGDYVEMIRAGRLDLRVQSGTRGENPESILAVLWALLQAIRSGVAPEGEASRLALALSASRFHLGNVRLNGVVAEIQTEPAISDGELRFQIPRFALAGNTRGNASGRLRGPIHLFQNPATRLDVSWRPQERRLELRGLDLEIAARRLFILPERFVAQLGYPGASLGLDGSLEGDFAMSFPEELRRWHGRGELRLRGDRAGDLYLLDRRGRRIHPPLLRNTLWRWRRIDSVRPERGYALGDFHLDLLINPEIFVSERMRRRADLHLDLSENVVDGRGRRLEPWEFQAAMQYDNQPVTPAQFRNRIVDYILTLFREYAERCASGASEPPCDLVREACRERPQIHPACEAALEGDAP